MYLDEVISINKNDLEEAKGIILKIFETDPEIVRDGKGFYYNKETGILCDEKGNALQGKEGFSEFVKTIKAQGINYIFYSEPNHVKVEKRNDLTDYAYVLVENNLPYFPEIPENTIMKFLEIKKKDFSEITSDEMLAKRDVFIKNSVLKMPNGTGEEKRILSESIFNQLLEFKKKGVKINFSKDEDIIENHPDYSALMGIFPYVEDNNRWIFNYIAYEVDFQRRENIASSQLNKSESGFVFYGIDHTAKSIDLNNLLKNNKKSVFVAAIDSEEDLMNSYVRLVYYKNICADHVSKIRFSANRKNVRLEEFDIEFPEYVYDATQNVFIKVDIEGNPQCIAEKIKKAIAYGEEQFTELKTKKKYEPLGYR